MSESATIITGIVVGCTSGVVAWAVCSMLKSRREASRSEALKHDSLLFQHSQDIVIARREGDDKVVVASDAACRFFGMPRETLLGMNFGDLDRIVPITAELDVRKCAAESWPSFMTRVVDAEGSPRVLDIEAKLVESETVRWVVITGRDMTHRVAREQPVENWLGAVEAFVDATPLPAAIVSAVSCKVLRKNSLADGVLVDHSQGESVKSADASEDGTQRESKYLLPCWQRAMHKASGERTPASQVEKVAGATNSITSVSLVYAGQAALLVMVKPLDGSEARSLQLVNAIVENALEAIIVFDPANMGVVMANGAASRLYGYTKEELLLLTCDDLVTDRMGARELFASALKYGSRAGELRYHRKRDGEVIEVEANYSTIPLSGRKGILSSMRVRSPAVARSGPVMESVSLSRHAASGGAPAGVESLFRAIAAPAHADNTRVSSGSLITPRDVRREHSSRHVLVVDDDASVRDVIRRMVESAGHKVTCEADGPRAIERVRSDSSIDVVLLDVTMPGMEGPDALAHMRKMRSDLPAIVCSGYSSEAVESAQTSAEGVMPVTQFIQKPFTLRSLLEALARCGGGAAVSTAVSTEVSPACARSE